MGNVLRTLIYDGQVSLTVADTTAMVQEGVSRHHLCKDTALVFGKTLCAMTFMSACLKEEKGEISLAVKSNGLGGDVGISGNHALHLRGYIENTNARGTESEILGDEGALTIIRDDGYNRPFVGSSALSKVGVDASFEEYFAISEQLPTRIKTKVAFDEKGGVRFAGVVALQPLPFAETNVLESVQNLDISTLLDEVQEKGVKETVEKAFVIDETVWEERACNYQCNCSKEYLKRVLVSLGKTQIQEILDEEGEVRVHCHYCNTDYQFTQADADALFNVEENIKDERQ